MPRQFARSGIRIQYPENWKLETEETDDGWSVTFLSTETAFLTVIYHQDEDEPTELADFALEAIKDNYPDLESESTVETLAGQPAVGFDVGFIALDLTNTCWIRSLAGPEGCLLLMGQCTDQELESNGTVMQAICASLTFEDSE